MPFEKIRDDLKSEIPDVQADIDLQPIIDNLKEFLGKVINISITVLRQGAELLFSSIKEGRK